MKDRLQALLAPTGKVAPGTRHFDPDRYEASRELDGESVLLLDDTWTSGGHAQSDAYKLKASGAENVGLVAVGRHVDPGWIPEYPDGKTCRELYDEVPKEFDWSTCAAEG